MSLSCVPSSAPDDDSHDQKGFCSNRTRFHSLSCALRARRPPRCRVRSRKVRIAPLAYPRRRVSVHARFARPALFPGSALTLTAISRTRPHVSRRFQVHAAGAAGVAPDADASVGTFPALAPTTVRQPRPSRARGAPSPSRGRAECRAASFRSPPNTKTGATRTFPGKRAPMFFSFSFSSRVARSNADPDRTAPDHSISD